MREIVGLACGECKRCNYSTTINKKGRKKGDKLEIRRYCKFCRKHTLHKEIGL
ncbi:MAG: 50S ribosomal protein L33 [Candidatus Omnitrophica bacterium]|nr:50S ribosomal protein L33 [Candidatus Omnitrophota bacterium]